MSDFGFRVSGLGFQVSGFRSRVSDLGFRVPCFGFLVPGSGFRVSGLGFQVSSFGSRVSDLGFRVPCFGFLVTGSGFRVSGFGFRVPASGFRVPGLVSRVSGSDYSVKLLIHDASAPAPPVWGLRSQFKNTFFTKMCGGSDASSYLRLTDFVYHSSLGLRVIKKTGKVWVAGFMKCAIQWNIVGLKPRGQPRRTFHLFLFYES